MKLSRTVSYAVSATLQLAQQMTQSGTYEPVPCSRLAATGNMPERFLLQILRTLVTSGILRSTRGVDGGYSLSKPANEISLLDLIEAIEGPLQVDHPLAAGLPDASQRKLAKAVDQVVETSRRQLAAIKLSQLVTPAGD